MLSIKGRTLLSVGKLIGTQNSLNGPIDTLALGIDTHTQQSSVAPKTGVIN